MPQESKENFVPEVYDPIKYWNARSQPNTKKDPGISNAHRDFIQRNSTGCRSILEIGPGVGRLFPLYKSFEVVSTVDISKKYVAEASNTAAQNGLIVSMNFLDTPADVFPFRDGQFDVGIASYVLIHVPFEYIVHTMSELVRSCRKVMVISGIDARWPKNEKERLSSSHCFTHDYASIAKSLGCAYSESISTTDVVAFVYQKI